MYDVHVGVGATSFIEICILCPGDSLKTIVPFTRYPQNQNPLFLMKLS